MRRRQQTQLVSVLVSGGKPDPFTLMVEPEGMSYEFPAEGKVLLTFRGAGAGVPHLSLDLTAEDVALTKLRVLAAHEAGLGLIHFAHTQGELVV